MKKQVIIFLAVAAAFFPAVSKGQTYMTAVGVRVDKGFNITGQQYIDNGWTVEGIFHTPFRTKELGVSLLGEKHHKILLRNLNFYWGGGAHYYWKTASTENKDSIKNNVFGLTGIAGVELSMGRLNFSVDFKPELHFAGDQVRPFEWQGTAISVRYIIEKRKRNRIKDWDGWDRMPSKKGKKRRN